MMQNKRYNKTKPTRLCKQKQQNSYKKKDRSLKYKLKDITKPERHPRQNLTYKACRKNEMDTKRTISKKPSEKHSEKHLYKQEFGPKRTKNKKVYKKIIGMM